MVEVRRDNYWIMARQNSYIFLDYRLSFDNMKDH